MMQLIVTGVVKVAPWRSLSEPEGGRLWLAKQLPGIADSLEPSKC